MSDIVVYRYVNVFYYLVFLAYIVLFLIYIIPRRKEAPYKNAYRIFWGTSVVLIAMEWFGTFSGGFFAKPLRVFYIGGEYNMGLQLLLQLIMGLGEGGASTGIMYLMVEAVYNKQVKRYFIFLVIFSSIMIVFVSFTQLYKLT